MSDRTMRGSGGDAAAATQETEWMLTGPATKIERCVPPNALYPPCMLARACLFASRLYSTCA